MQSVVWWSTILVLLVATVSDLRSRRIPNWLVLPFLMGGFVFSWFARGWSGFAHSLQGMLVAALLLGIFYCLGGMGMGDVKLCAGIGAWVGPQQVLFALAFMGLAGGIMAFSWAICGGFWKEMMQGTGDLIFGFGKRGLRQHETLVLSNPRVRKMPYAPAIAIGTIFSFFAVS